MPDELAPVDGLIDWRGPTVSPDALPHFEISQEPGGVTTYRRGVWGSDGHPTPDDVPMDLPPGVAHVVPMKDPADQTRIATRLKDLSWTVSCGTYGGATRKHRDAVLEAFGVADLFFCNESEAVTLFGSPERARTGPGRVLFVTLGEQGARVISGNDVTSVEGVRVDELDPTGAGDTFCGTVLAHLARGADPLAAARLGVAAAADMITGVGPERLMRPSPMEPPDPGGQASES